jgi:hypothetical protein
LENEADLASHPSFFGTKIADLHNAVGVRIAVKLQQSGKNS